MHRFVPLLVGMGGLILFTCLPSSATQIEYRDLPTLGAESSSVVRGEVIDLSARWNASGTRILTQIDLRIDDSYKGGNRSTLRVLQAGGSLDGVRMTVHGAASFELGEQVLLFVEANDRGDHRLAGFSQGKFRLVEDPVSGEWIAERASIDAELIGAKSKADGALRLRLSELLEQSLGMREEGR